MKHSTHDTADKPRGLGPRVDLAVKLLAVAVDASAGEGEALNAASKFVQIVRRERLGLDDLRDFFRADHAFTFDPPPAPPACRVEMPFGKYAGVTLSEIAENDPCYLAWAVEHLYSREDIRRACEVVAGHYGLVEVAA